MLLDDLEVLIEQTRRFSHPVAGLSVVCSMVPSHETRWWCCNDAVFIDWYSIYASTRP